MLTTEYQRSFIDFLLASKALCFGDYITKSGRSTPYFINTGQFRNGAQIRQLGEFYAKHALSDEIDDFDIVFGPAYKGIPLCISTVIALNHLYPEREIGYCFDRKELKGHGDGGGFVGMLPQPEQRLLLVEDVVTAGSTLKSIIPRLRKELNAKVSDIVIAVDRQEKGSGHNSALQELEQDLDIIIHPIVTITQILNYLPSVQEAIDSDVTKVQDSIRTYLESFGAV